MIIQPILSKWLLSFIALLLCLLQCGAAAVGTLISAPSRVDMVYDSPRDILYITSGNVVLRYQLATDSFLSPFQLSGTLKGIDLSPDGNTLLVADATASATNVWVYQIDLRTGKTNQVPFSIASGESGTFAVSFGGDGAALITSRFAGSGWVPLRRYDPTSGTVTTVSSFIRQDSMVSCSGDGTTIIIAESGSSSGPMDLYDVASRTIAITGGTGHYNYECGASRDGSLFALPTYFSTLIYGETFNQVTNIGVYAGAQPVGVAFHPAADAVFFPFAGTTFVNAYSTTTWGLLAQFDVQNSFPSPSNHAFGQGRIRISPDGAILFVTVSGGIRYFRHNLSLPLTHRLVVAGNPGPYGNSTPVPYGTNWFPHGTNLTLQVPAVADTNSTRFISAGWTRTGSAMGSGVSTSTTFSLTANTTMIWNWIPFALTATIESQIGGAQCVLGWPSLSGSTYELWSASSPNSAFTRVVTNLTATPPANTYSFPLERGGAAFYRVQMK